MAGPSYTHPVNVYLLFVGIGNDPDADVKGVYASLADAMTAAGVPDGSSWVQSLPGYWYYSKNIGIEEWPVTGETKEDRDQEAAEDSERAAQQIDL